MKSPFIFQAPEWLNSASPDTVEEALGRAEDIASAYYPAGVQTGIHSMIEWCGVMTEYTKMLREAHKAGHDVREVDKHHGKAVEVPDFMVEYFCEKLGCQLIPFIRGNPVVWKQAIDGWFSEALENWLGSLESECDKVGSMPIT